MSEPVMIFVFGIFGIYGIAYLIAQIIPKHRTSSHKSYGDKQ